MYCDSKGLRTGAKIVSQFKGGCIVTERRLLGARGGRWARGWALGVCGARGRARQAALALGGTAQAGRWARGHAEQARGARGRQALGERGARGRQVLGARGTHCLGARAGLGLCTRCTRPVFDPI